MQEPGPYRDAARADVVDLIHLQCVNPGAHLRTESCRAVSHGHILPQNRKA